MPINSITTTTLVHECPYDAVEDTITIAAELVAGVTVSGTQHANAKGGIKLPACPGCGAVTVLYRTFDNPAKEAGAVNALHRRLVDDLSLTAAIWTAALNAETDDDKPSFHYTLSGVALTFERGTNGAYPFDMAQVATLLGPTEATARQALGLIFTDDDDAAIAGFVGEILAVESEVLAANARIKAARLQEFGI